jgi:hypothetical protein
MYRTGVEFAASNDLIKLPKRRHWPRPNPAPAKAHSTARPSRMVTVPTLLALPMPTGN